jgi:hypothetical protein
MWLGFRSLLFSSLLLSSPAQSLVGVVSNHVVTQSNAEQFGLAVVMAPYDNTGATYKVGFVSKRPRTATLFIVRPEYIERYEAGENSFFDAIDSELILMHVSLNQYRASDGRFFREFELHRAFAAYAYIYIAPSLPRRLDPSCEEDWFFGRSACARHVLDGGKTDRYLLRMVDFLPIVDE